MPSPQNLRRSSRPQTAPAIGDEPDRPAEQSSLGKGSKRISNACVRCRKQKIRCSGQAPCDACSKRKLDCEFNEGDQKILVRRGYIEDLQSKVAALERKRSRSQSPHGSSAGIESEDEQDSVRPRQRRRLSISSSNQHRPPSEANESLSRSDSLNGNPVKNLLSTGQSTFSTASNGKTYYQGTSSNWSFARRILSMTHDHLLQSPLPTTDLLFDGEVYDLGWEGPTKMTPYDTPAMPTLDYSIYLINSVKFHCGQVYHLFDEQSFMASLYEYYREPTTPEAFKKSMWYVHFLLILAFGKAFTTKRNQSKRPAGSEYFVKAFELLPDAISIWQDPVMATEILCCVALYLQCVDYRIVAHNFIGQAMRMALGQGMHTNIPIDLFGERFVERSRRIWWTIYVLDREMTSLVGLPQSLSDRQIYPELPKFAESPQRRQALDIEIRLSRVIARINREIYGADGKLNSRFLASTKHVLEDLAAVSDELQRIFPLQLDNSITGVSRTSAHLHLLYYQCIVLATRPLIFCFLKFRLENPEICTRKMNASGTVRNLIQMCLDSSLQMVMILESLQSQGLLEAFLPFDLQSLFISTVNLSVAPALHPHLVENQRFWLYKAFFIFDEMIDSGNQVAAKHKSELNRIIELLEGLPGDSQHGLAPFPVSASGESGLDFTSRPEGMDSIPALAAHAIPTPISSGTGIIDDEGIGHLLTTSQMIDMANSVDCGDTDWMSDAIMAHSIWQG